MPGSILTAKPVIKNCRAQSYHKLLIRKLQGPIVPQNFNKETAGPNCTAKLWIRKFNCRAQSYCKNFNTEIPEPNCTATFLMRKFQGPCFRIFWTLRQREAAHVEALSSHRYKDDLWGRLETNSYKCCQH